MDRLFSSSDFRLLIVRRGKNVLTFYELYLFEYNRHTLNRSLFRSFLDKAIARTLFFLILSLLLSFLPFFLAVMMEEKEKNK